MMTKEEQRIAIAEWEFKSLGGVVTKDGKFVFWSPTLNRHTSEIPNYPEDLNAMHEVEMNLKLEHRTCFAMNVRTIVVRDAKEGMTDPDTGLISDLYFYGATASQRSEALCRTLWPERFA